VTSLSLIQTSRYFGRRFCPYFKHHVILKIFSVPLQKRRRNGDITIIQPKTKLWTINTTTNIEQNHTECPIGIIWDMDIISFYSQPKIVNIIYEKSYKTVDGASVILSKQCKKYVIILTRSKNISPQKAT